MGKATKRKREKVAQGGAVRARATRVHARPVQAHAITSKATAPHTDTRPAQAVRVANYLEKHPASTQKEIDAVADTGCISKVLSDMPGLGYGLSKGWREVTCAAGKRTRLVRTYTLLYRPSTQPDLFTPIA